MSTSSSAQRGQVWRGIKRLFAGDKAEAKPDGESAETNRMMGLALQGQGQLDSAFERFRQVPLTDALMDNLLNLALDFERKRQYTTAQAVYEHMATFRKDYKDLQGRIARAKTMAESTQGGGAGQAGGLTLDDTGKTMLGRYQIDKELGKGAMGVVYMGRDPKINRVLAIKTMALSQEFEGEDLADARARFFREAETAGRLQHQNIVTIFDAGEEQDLAYIAMEFIKGRDLVGYCKDANLLPPAKVVSIVARVAEALAYAHRQNVVHRDIKPANIMYDLESDTVKVTDFGIARITDSNKTKTGLVLGTPSFMSPEQIAGKKVDGRSDLYSLGVMLYQMLTGMLPFRGDSMAELMYKIANEQAPDIRALRKDLPARLAGIVAQVLSKKPEARLPDGDQLAAALRVVLMDLGADPAGQPASAGVPLSLGEATQAQATAEKTVIMAAAAIPAPGYHPAPQAQAAPTDPYEKTAVFQRPDVTALQPDVPTDPTA